MPKKKPVDRPEVLDWPQSYTFDDGRVLNAGDEFTVKGEGRYKMRYLRPNGEVTCWGPINSKGLTPDGRMRSFRLEDISIVHEKWRAQKVLRHKIDVVETNDDEELPEDIW